MQRYFRLAREVLNVQETLCSAEVVEFLFAMTLIQPAPTSNIHGLDTRIMKLSTHCREIPRLLTRYFFMQSTVWPLTIRIALFLTTASN